MMTNDQIAAAVLKILDAFPAKAMPTPDEQAGFAAVQAAGSLLINLLQNINTIANRKS